MTFDKNFLIISVIMILSIESNAQFRSRDNIEIKLDWSITEDSLGKIISDFKRDILPKLPQNDNVNDLIIQIDSITFFTKSSTDLSNSYIEISYPLYKLMNAFVTCKIINLEIPKDVNCIDLVDTLYQSHIYNWNFNLSNYYDFSRPDKAHLIKKWPKIQLISELAFKEEIYSQLIHEYLHHYLGHTSINFTSKISKYGLEAQLDSIFEPLIDSLGVVSGAVSNTFIPVFDLVSINYPRYTSFEVYHQLLRHSPIQKYIGHVKMENEFVARISYPTFLLLLSNESTYQLNFDAIIENIIKGDMLSREVYIQFFLNHFVSDPEKYKQIFTSKTLVEAAFDGIRGNSPLCYLYVIYYYLLNNNIEMAKLFFDEAKEIFGDGFSISEKYDTFLDQYLNKEE